MPNQYFDGRTGRQAGRRKERYENHKAERGKNTMDWLAAAFSLSGFYITGRKLWYGWAFAILGCALWVVYGYTIRSWGMVVVNVIFIVIFSDNLRRWRRESLNKTTQQDKLPGAH